MSINYPTSDTLTLREISLDVYRTEEEQVEALKKWWQENGKSAVIGLVVGLGAIFGWRMWQEEQLRQAEAASEMYQQMVIAVRDDNDPDQAQKTAEQILNDHESTVYAVFAKLLLAKLAVDAQDLESATEHLRWSLDNNHGGSLEHLIRLRLARILLARDKSDAASSIINVKQTGQFGAAYDELHGDIKHLDGDIEAARIAYQQALTKTQASRNDISVLEIKLDELGRIDFND